MHFPPVKPEVLFSLGSIPITNSMLTSWVAMILLVVVGYLVGKNFKRLPSGMQHIFEMVYELFDGMAVDAAVLTGVTDSSLPWPLPVHLLLLPRRVLQIVLGRPAVVRRR